MKLKRSTFYPGGAEAVRIRFVVEGGSVQSLSVFDPGPIVTARRV